MTSGFPTSSEISPHTSSTSASYDSLSAHMSTGQLYEDSSNDSSVFSGSVFTGTLDSSSVTSTGLDASSDGSSRKDSLSSTCDGHLQSELIHSPEIENIVWPPASTSAVQVSAAVCVVLSRYKTEYPLLSCSQFLHTISAMELATRHQMLLCILPHYTTLRIASRNQ